ncbi:3-deoxy-manno-octulosonate cytidylyltransferase [candidate division NPL-UPA2 bacterium Unc8]|uniref:3-deoxy-manno-octulosonate cytidylyltransferase n=1 Tax=candidate division NPL-UPA2 bacterium Unc8 TaxID=1980939 RepID=A0A399FX12_UNCN2|nr:3-deoxy-manno-octulosonate cytidylyltransferase [Bacillota bacterium]RII00587.1 MAG: 3-deoxy-manno-octulosonate cytidylyltransferase [candidate division NPL-UPA2 bacterium Unc8]
MEKIGIIPARYNSRRLPGKPLLDICGKTIIERVYRQAEAAKVLDRIIVATDDERIMREVRRFGGEVLLVRGQFSSGSDRVAATAARLRLPNSAIIVNIQCDAPLLPPAMIKALLKPLLKNHSIPVSALYAKIKDEKELMKTDIVKVVVDCNEFALFFSRLPIPYFRDQKRINHYKHIGPYAYCKLFLHKLAKMPPTPLEKAEKLEQLRILENGYRIKMVKTRQGCPEVDTPEDIREVRKLCSHSE